MKAPIGTLVVIAGLMLAGCSREQKKAEAATTKQPDPIEIQGGFGRKRRKSIKPSQSQVRFIPTRPYTLALKFPDAYRLSCVDFGQTVRKGQVVAELDKQELTLAVDRSKAALAQALARLGLDPGSGKRYGRTRRRLSVRRWRRWKTPSRNSTTLRGWSRPATSRRSASRRSQKIVSGAAGGVRSSSRRSAYAARQRAGAAGRSKAGAEAAERCYSSCAVRWFSRAEARVARRST